MSNKSTLAAYRIIKIHRPQLPHILKWIDREFQVIYINMDAGPNAKIACLVDNDNDDESGSA